MQAIQLCYVPRSRRATQHGNNCYFEEEIKNESISYLFCIIWSRQASGARENNIVYCFAYFTRIQNVLFEGKNFLRDLKEYFTFIVILFLLLLFWINWFCVFWENICGWWLAWRILRHLLRGWQNGILLLLIWRVKEWVVAGNCGLWNNQSNLACRKMLLRLRRMSGEVFVSTLCIKMQYAYRVWNAAAADGVENDVFVRHSIG